ncbi:MAG: hypothetical protein Q8N16_00940 [bacterium]|nr:hypothetical protein [bacterium]
MKIVIEGLWALGKTLACEFLEKKHDFVFIREPDHKKHKLEKTDLDRWYYDKHLENLEKAMEVESDVVLERSVASTLSFIKSRDSKDALVRKLIADERFLAYKNFDLCIIFNINYKDYLIGTKSLDNKDLKEFILINDKLVRNYNRNLKLYCEMLFGKDNTKSLNVFKDSAFVEEKIIRNLIEKLIYEKKTE